MGRKIRTLPLWKREESLVVKETSNTFAKTYTMNSWVPIYNVGGDYTGSRGT